MHYCDEAEIRGYVTCDGEGCLLCRVGKDAEPRRLLPLYVPTERRVDVLMMSTSSRPGALMPQLIDTLASAFGGDGSERVVLSIRKRDYYKFEISSRLLPEDVDDGTEVIKRFMADVEAGKIDITSVVQRFTTKSLLAIPAIAQRAALKGVEARP